MKSEQLTRTDIKRIEDEINYRKTVVRPAALKALKEARALGDLSENFEYYAAKRDNNQNNSRIHYLEKMLQYATVVEEDNDESRIGLNDTVEVIFDGEDAVETYRIVTSIRSDSLRNLISSESPMGQALIGHSAGDRVEVVVDETNSYFVTVVSISKTGEIEEDAIQRF